MKMLRIALALSCCGFVMSGCFSTTEQELCKRADDCNLLSQGVSVEECTDNYTKCTKDLTSADRADWETGTADCLKMQSCTNFQNCFGNVPGCQ